MKIPRLIVSVLTLAACVNFTTNAFALEAKNANSQQAKIDTAALKECLLGIRKEMKVLHKRIVKSCKSGTDQQTCDLAKAEAEATHSALHEKMKTCVRPSGAASPVAQVGQ